MGVPSDNEAIKTQLYSVTAIFQVLLPLKTFYQQSTEVHTYVYSCYFECVATYVSLVMSLCSCDFLLISCIWHYSIRLTIV